MESKAVNNITDPLIKKLREGKRKSYQVIINELAKEGINFYEDKNIELQNVVFEKDGHEYKIYQGLFYRVSGQCVTMAKDDFIPLTDKMFYQMQKDFVLYHFRINNLI